jgi:hypothetical protein
MQLVMAALHKANNLSEKVINYLLDLIMGKAIAYFGLDNRQTPQLESGLR